jgi:diguanylate cyclase (GGDEF)-like protein/PAS domain S-box-containing protein
MVGAYANETKERAELSVYRDIEGVTSFEGYLSGLLATAPQGDKLPALILGQLGQQVEAAISQLHGLEGSDRDRDETELATLMAADTSFQATIAQTVSLLGQADQLSAYYRQRIVPSYARLSGLVRAAIARQSREAARSGADARLSAWLVYGVGTALIAVALLRFAFVQRRAGRRKANLEADALRREFQSIVDQSGVAMFVCDLDGRYVLANCAFDELLDLAPGGAVGRRREDVVPPKLVGPMAAADRRVAAGETDVDERVYAVRGEERLLSTFKFPLARPDGEVYGICGIVTDVTDIRQIEVQIERLVDHDPLTGLYNRRRLIGELERHLEHATRHRRSGAVLLLDIDNFKLLNDVYGHTTGDQQLVSVAHVLGERVREADTLARLGSDEFAVVLVDVSEQQAVTIATHIRRSCPSARPARRLPQASASACSTEPTTSRRTTSWSRPTLRCTRPRKQAADARSCTADSRRRRWAGCSGSVPRSTRDDSSSTASRSSTCEPIGSATTSCSSGCSPTTATAFHPRHSFRPRSGSD